MFLKKFFEKPSVRVANPRWWWALGMETRGWGDGGVEADGRWWRFHGVFSLNMGQRRIPEHHFCGVCVWFLIGLECFLVELNLSERWQKECFFLLPRLWKWDWFDSLPIDLTVSAWWVISSSWFRNPESAPVLGVTWSDPIYEGSPQTWSLSKRWWARRSSSLSEMTLFFYSPGFRYLHFFRLLSTWWFQICFIFTPKLGEDEPILTHIFQMGWNHQPVVFFGVPKKQAAGERMLYQLQILTSYTDRQKYRIQRCIKTYLINTDYLHLQ